MLFRVYAVGSHPLALCATHLPPPRVEQVLPEAPAELRAELSRRYVLLYEKITGQQFQPAPLAEDPAQRMRKNVTAALQELGHA
jgi:hypothetical protein